MQSSGWSYDVLVDLSGYRQNSRPTRHDWNPVTALDLAEATLAIIKDRERAEELARTPLPELTRRPTPAGAIPSVFIDEDVTADLTDILVTGPDGEVL